MTKFVIMYIAYLFLIRLLNLADKSVFQVTFLLSNLDPLNAPCSNDDFCAFDFGFWI